MDGHVLNAGVSSDRHPWRTAVVLGVFLSAVGMAVSILFELIGGGWLVPGDVWFSVVAARYIGNGALGFVYESHPSFVSFPGLPILLAPIVALGDAMGLSETVPGLEVFHLEGNVTRVILRHPTMWLLIGPILYLSAIPLLWSARVATRRLRVATPNILQLAAGILVFAPLAFPYGKFEDVLALASVVNGARLLISGRPVLGSGFLSSAIFFKQWAAIGLPLFIAATPRGFRFRSLVAALALPGAFGAFTLVVDWEHAGRALFATPAFPGGHLAPWTVAVGETLPGANYLRLLSLAVPLIGVLLFRNRPEPKVLLTALGASYLSRVLVEPTSYAYYVAPGLLFMLLEENLTRGKLRYAPLLGAILIGLFAWYPDRWIWWLTMLATAAALAVPSLRRATS